MADTTENTTNTTSFTNTTRFTNSASSTNTTRSTNTTSPTNTTRSTNATSSTNTRETNNTTENNTISIAYLNIRGQTGLDITKQVQIENFIKTYKIDILNCQEINTTEDSFSQTDFINSSYQIITNNAANKYGTASIISNNFTPECSPKPIIFRHNPVLNHIYWNI